MEHLELASDSRGATPNSWVQSEGGTWSQRPEVEPTDKTKKGGTLLYTDLETLISRSSLRVELKHRVTQRRCKEVAAPLTPPPLCCVFATTPQAFIYALLGPLSLRSGRLTPGIYGNLKILSSAIVRYTQSTANVLCLAPPPPPPFYVRQTFTYHFPKPQSCFYLFNLCCPHSGVRKTQGGSWGASRCAVDDTEQEDPSSLPPSHGCLQFFHLVTFTSVPVWEPGPSCKQPIQDQSKGLLWGPAKPHLCRTEGFKEKKEKGERDCSPDISSS